MDKETFIADFRFQIADCGFDFRFTIVDLRFEKNGVRPASLKLCRSGSTPYEKGLEVI